MAQWAQAKFKPPKFSFESNLKLESGVMRAQLSAGFIFIPNLELGFAFLHGEYTKNKKCYLHSDSLQFLRTCMMIIGQSRTDNFIEY